MHISGDAWLLANRRLRDFSLLRRFRAIAEAARAKVDVEHSASRRAPCEKMCESPNAISPSGHLRWSPARRHARGATLRAMGRAGSARAGRMATTFRALEVALFYDAWVDTRPTTRRTWPPSGLRGQVIRHDDYAPPDAEMPTPALFQAAGARSGLRRQALIRRCYYRNSFDGAMMIAVAATEACRDDSASALATDAGDPKRRLSIRIDTAEHFFTIFPALSPVRPPFRRPNSGHEPPTPPPTAAEAPHADYYGPTWAAARQAPDARLRADGLPASRHAPRKSLRDDYRRISFHLC